MIYQRGEKMYRIVKIGSGIVLLVLLISNGAFSQDLNQNLIQAAKRGDTATVKSLLDKGADVNAKSNKSGATALIFAAELGHFKIAETLLARGADVNIKDNKFGGTALLVAAMYGHINIVEALLTKGADVNAKSNDGWTALMTAAQRGHSDIVEALLNKEADVNIHEKIGGHTLLMVATAAGHADIVAALLAKGAEVNAKNIHGETALMYAAEKGSENIVKLLIESGANVNIKTKKGQTASMLAEDAGHIEIVELLVADGPDINIIDKTEHEDITPPPSEDEDAMIFVSYDEPPQPIGGFKQIQDNLVYPDIAKKAGVEGRVLVYAQIGIDGIVLKTKIAQSLGPNGCDEAAIKAVKSVKWLSAKNKGEPVAVWISVPVDFKLN